ncbi:maker265 [Drosophila busckii]|uniref:Maker265 n=1 Tax=Drosophila busckii TaxID=30019 RepID=A0A0M4F7K9_DROBS|nr:uncharacterized protein LOC108607178 [Drosophila busckii]ALC48200.1 maker265 [Drosophila busckii]
MDELKEQNEEQLLGLLKDAISPIAERARASSEQLRTQCVDAESMLRLCDVLGDIKYTPGLRKCAGNTLRQRLMQQQAWQELQPQLPAAQSRLMTALKSLRSDDDEALQLAVVQNVAQLMQLQLDNDVREWNEQLFELLAAHCKLAEQQLLSLSLLKLLLSSAPKLCEQYLPQMQRILLQGVQQSCNEATPLSELLLSAWSLAIPLYSKQCAHCLEQLSASVCPIVQLTRVFAREPHPRRSCRGLQTLQKLLKHAPEQVWPQLPLLLNELCQLSGDVYLSDELRTQALLTLKSCVQSRRRQIIRLKLMDRLLMTLHQLLAVPPALSSAGEELYFGSTRSALAEATQILIHIASESNTARVAERALRLMQPQLASQRTALQRLAALLFLALMTQGFSDMLPAKPLQGFIATLATGFADEERVVRRAAHFALSIMAECLQPEITKQAAQLMPLFTQYIDQLSDEQRRSDIEPSTQTRMFCTLEIYCESLQPHLLQPYAADLMQRLLKLCQPGDNSPSLRQMAFSAIECVAKILKSDFVAYFDRTLELALLLIKDSSDDDYLLLRSNAVQIINALSAVDGDKFKQQAPQLLAHCMELRQHEEGQLLTYKTMGLICEQIPEQLTPHFAVLVKEACGTIKELLAMPKKADSDADEDAAEQTESAADDDDDDDDDDEEDEAEELTEERHGDQTDNETEGSSLSSMEGSSVDYADGAREAILCLKQLAQHMPDALLPQLMEAERRVTSAAARLEESGKCAVFETLTQFVVLYARQRDMAHAKRKCQEMLPQLINFMRNAKDMEHVVVGYDCLKQLLQLLKAQALAGAGARQLLFGLLRRTLRRGLPCQFNASAELDMEALQHCSQALLEDQLVLQRCCELLPIFGACMSAHQFADHLQLVRNRVLKFLHQSKSSSSSSSLLYYNLLWRCMPALGALAAEYQELLAQLVAACATDAQPAAREFAWQLADWLLQHWASQHAAATLPHLERACSSALLPAAPLSAAERACVCGLSARLMLRDNLLQPALHLDKLLALLFTQLPLAEQCVHYTPLLQALLLLQQQQPQLLQQYAQRCAQLFAAPAHLPPAEATRAAAAQLLIQLTSVAT